MSAPRVPTADDIRRLPRWARVAFAARCARQAEPSFSKTWFNAPEKYLHALANAIAFAETAAVDARVDEAGRIAASAARFATNADPAFVAASTIAVRAAAAAEAAIAAAHTVSYDASTVPNTAYAAETAAQAAAKAAAAGVPVASILVDFQTVRELALAGSWTDDTSVPPSVFGPVNGPLTSLETPQAEPLVTLSLCGGGFTAGDLNLILRYLSALDREHGGSGLKVLRGRQMQPAEVGVRL